MSVKVLYIIGTPYCGSTLLGYQMGSNPRCASIGEVWNRVFREYHYGECATCGKDCRYLTDAFLDGLTLETVYPRFAELFGVSVLLDGSKSVEHYKAITAAIEGNSDIYIRPVILYRSPVEYHASGRARGFEKQIGEWASVYREALNATANNPPRLIISHDDYVNNNDGYLSFLCGFAGMNYNDNMVEYWNHEHHALGGSKVANLSINEAEYTARMKQVFKPEIYELERDAFYKRIRVRNKAHDVLTEREIEEISGHAETQQVFNELQEMRLIL